MKETSTEGGQGRVLLFYCSMAFDTQVFLRLRSALAARGWSVVAVTHLLSSWLRLKAQGIPCELLRPTLADAPLPDCSVEASPEYILQQIDVDRARRFQRSLWKALERSCRRHRVGALMVWNGLFLFGQVMTAFARARKMPIIYCELGNFGGGLFIDPDGVNAKSRLSRHPELLDDIAVDEDEMATWRQAYLTRQTAGAPLPQSKWTTRINRWFALDWFGYVVCRVPQPKYVPLLTRIKVKWSIRHKVQPSAVCPERPYVFLPLQVSADTNQVLLSPVNNLGALDYAADLAEKNGWLLVVKPHPAETDTSLAAVLRARCAEAGRLMTTVNTTGLVLGAEHVVTINSTVGLEALILGKPLTVLGQSLYGRFTRRQAHTFVMRHMINFRPFGEEPATPETADRIIALIEAEARALSDDWCVKSRPNVTPVTRPIIPPL